MAEKIFGTTIINSDGRVVPVRFIGEQHVKEDLGRIPTVAEWLAQIQPANWMLGKNRLKDIANERHYAAAESVASSGCGSAA